MSIISYLPDVVLLQYRLTPALTRTKLLEKRQSALNWLLVAAGYGLDCTRYFCELDRLAMADLAVWEEREQKAIERDREGLCSH